LVELQGSENAKARTKTSGLCEHGPERSVNYGAGCRTGTYQLMITKLPKKVCLQ
jgi:hypothetical protein